MWVTVYKYKGLEIKTKSPAKSDELGYVVDGLVGQKFNLIQDAIDAIDQVKSPRQP